MRKLWTGTYMELGMAGCEKMRGGARQHGEKPGPTWEAGLSRSSGPAKPHEGLDTPNGGSITGFHLLLFDRDRVVCCIIFIHISLWR